jgi:ABC-type sugar transport system ATPase subunit
MSLTPVLEMKEIVKQYPGVRAVNSASISLMPGEVHALVGENGAGKSTLIKIMAGVVRPDEGEIFLNGSSIHLRNGSDAYKLGLSFIHQELNLVPHLSGAENIFLGRVYPKTALGTVDWKKLNQRAKDILDTLGVHVPVDVPVVNLSRGDQSMISIARAFAGEASIVVMDEPTASLTDEEIHSLFNVIRELKSRCHTVLYVSHRLDEIFEICDRVTIMRDGSVVGTYNIAEINQAEMIRLMIGRSLSESFPASEAVIGPTLLEGRQIGRGMVKDVSFTLKKGEILGFAGLVGAGRTEILRMLYGVDKPAQGEILLDGAPFNPKDPAEAIRAGVVLVPEERSSQGLILNRSIRENITLPHLGKISSGGLFINLPAERTVSEKMGNSVRLKAASLTQKVSQLSGGNQQKVVFARWLIQSPRILLLDEPSRGVDVGARYEIYRIIRDLAAHGVGIVLVSSDLTELLGLADRVIVMREGHQMAELNTAGLSQETVLRYCYGEEK